MSKPEKDDSAEEQRSPEEIREDTEQTREELGDTAAALAGKADVKGQAKSKIDEAKRTAREKTDELTGKAKGIGAKAQEASPEKVGAGANSAFRAAQENPIPLAALAIFAAGLLLGLILRR